MDKIRFAVAGAGGRMGRTLIEAILKTVVDGIITLQAGSGRIETVNPAAEQMFGYTAAELIGQDFSLLIPELAQGQSAASLEHYSASPEARALTHLRRRARRRARRGRRR